MRLNMVNFGKLGFQEFILNDLNSCYVVMIVVDVLVLFFFANILWASIERKPTLKSF